MRSLLRLVPWFAVPALIACGGSGGGGGQPLPTSHALSFDGVDDLAFFAMTVSASTTFTVEAWINPTTVAPAAVSTGIVYADGAHQIYLPADRTTFGYSVSNPATTGPVSAMGTIQAGEWQHLAGVYDGAEVRIYRNGALVGTVPHPGTANGASNLIVGSFPVGAFAGLIDEVRLWNTARTQGEIQASMGSILTGSEAGLLAYWRFEEASGQDLLDTTPNNRDGTLGSNSNAAADDPTRVTPGAPVS